MKKPNSPKKVAVKKKTSRSSKIATPAPKARGSLVGLAKHFEGFKSPFVLFSLAVLIVSCVLWSVLGAQLQSNNADQLVSGYLFKDASTFHDALFPNAHTFLLKWPLFLLLGLSGNTNTWLTGLTVFVSLATVAGLVYILYRIDRRPRVLGSLILALSGVLLLIPAQPYAGGLLPVNFAMLTTRNIEYLFYIASLVLLIRAPRLRSKFTVGSLVLLSLLVASDRLFLFLPLGGALSMLAIYGILRQRQLVTLALRWLLVGVGAGLVATLSLWFIDASSFTNIAGQGDAGPYGFIRTLKQLGLGGIFAVFGTLTNFGANPLFDIGIVKDMPRILGSRIFQPATISFLTNIGLFVFGLIASLQIFKASLQKPKKSKSHAKQLPISTANSLSLLLITSSFVALALFVATDHYYAVDARYMTITLFALFISIATYLRSRPLPTLRTVKIITFWLLTCILISSFWAINTYKQQESALSGIAQRNMQIVSTLHNHKTDLLVGDYWRIMPIVQNKFARTTAVPLSNCMTMRTVLASSDRRTTLENHSFSYLLSLDKSLTDYPQCTLEQVVGFFGQPSTSTVIAGTKDNPIELLLFYDQGTNKLPAMSKEALLKGITPIELLQPSKNSSCAGGVAVMNVVAHEDDDILFMNPDLSHHIAAGHCVRTIYVTAGDAGQGKLYWLGRERGSQQAYSSLLGSNDAWDKQTVMLPDGEFVTVVNPHNNQRISLIYMRISDGGLRGKGFAASNGESIASLLSGIIPTVHTVDGQSRYTSDQLTAGLLLLMKTYQPTQINSQAMSDEGTTFHDHSDHITVGQYAQRAQQEYSSESAAVPITYYVGYPIRERPENVLGQDLSIKTKAFRAYGQFDGAACRLMIVCGHEPTYWAYLHREYTVEQWAR